MMRDLGRSVGDAVFGTVGRAVSRAQERRPLPVDLLESEEAFLAVFDAPGATSSDVQVRFEGRTVRVRVDRFREFHEGYRMLFPGRGLSLDGRVDLPGDAPLLPDEATAVLKDTGELHVRVPKGEPAAEAEPTEGEAAEDDSAAGTEREGEEGDA